IKEAATEGSATGPAGVAGTADGLVPGEVAMTEQERSLAGIQDPTGQGFRIARLNRAAETADGLVVAERAGADSKGSEGVRALVRAPPPPADPTTKARANIAANRLIVREHAMRDEEGRFQVIDAAARAEASGLARAAIAADSLVVDEGAVGDEQGSAGRVE